MTDAIEGMSEIGVIDAGDRLVAINPEYSRHPRLDWVIVGGESGAGARPMHPAWARSIRDQCEAAGVSFHFKQWGEFETAVDREQDDPDWRRDYSHELAHSAKHRWLNLAGGQGFHGECFHVMRRVGKKHAGRHLDGREHNAMPARSHLQELRP